MILAEAGFNIGDPEPVAAEEADGGRRVADGHRHLRAQRRALLLSGEEPTEVNAMMYSTPNDPRFNEVEENITFQLRFPGGILANCASSYGVGLNRYRVVKPNASAELEPALSYYRACGCASTASGAVEERVAAAASTTSAPRWTTSPSASDERASRRRRARRACSDLKIMMAIYEAARSGRTVTLA